MALFTHQIFGSDPNIRSYIRIYMAFVAIVLLFTQRAPSCYVSWLVSSVFCFLFAWKYCLPAALRAEAKKKDLLYYALTPRRAPGSSP